MPRTTGSATIPAASHGAFSSCSPMMEQRTQLLDNALPPSMRGGISPLYKKQMVGMPRSILKNTGSIPAAPQQKPAATLAGTGVVVVPSPANASKLEIMSHSDGGKDAPIARASITSPFEPLKGAVASHRTPFQQQRQHCACGTVSPYGMAEEQDDEDHVSSTQPPPIEEIRIPTPQQNDPAANDVDDSTTASSKTTTTIGNGGEDGQCHHLPTESEPDYKNLYFCSMRVNYVQAQRLTYLSEENRLLKRHMIEMQRQLYGIFRNRRQAAGSMAGGGVDTVANAAWTIPSPIQGGCNKKRARVQDADNNVQNDPSGVPKSVSSEQSQR
jgi:hypothetical protein